MLCIYSMRNLILVVVMTLLCIQGCRDQSSVNHADNMYSIGRYKAWMRQDVAVESQTKLEQVSATLLAISVKIAMNGREVAVRIVLVPVYRVTTTESLIERAVSESAAMGTSLPWLARRQGDLEFYRRADSTSSNGFSEFVVFRYRDLGYASATTSSSGVTIMGNGRLRNYVQIDYQFPKFDIDRRDAHHAVMSFLDEHLVVEE